MQLQVIMKKQAIFNCSRMLSMGGKYAAFSVEGD